MNNLLNWNIVSTSSIAAGNRSNNYSTNQTLRGSIYIHYINLSFTEFYTVAGVPSNEIFFLEFRLSKNSVYVGTVPPNFSGNNSVNKINYCYKDLYCKIPVYQSFYSGDVVTFNYLFWCLNLATAQITTIPCVDLVYELIE